MKNKSLFVALIVCLVLIADQAIKIYIKTNFEFGEARYMLGQSWAQLKFIENEGMAFGLQLGGNWGKLALSIFRIVAIGFLIYIIRELIKRGASISLLFSFGLILAGAVGNMIDSAFYGLIFSESVPRYHGGGVAEMFPEGGGYAGFMYGKVVDMFYFPMFDINIPNWVPLLGGNNYEFFSPIFNLADASISVGVFWILLFNRSFFKQEKNELEENGDTTSPSMEETPLA